MKLTDEAFLGREPVRRFTVGLREIGKTMESMGTWMWWALGALMPQSIRCGAMPSLSREGGSIRVLCCGSAQMRSSRLWHGRFRLLPPTTVGTECYFTTTQSCIEAAVRGRIVGE
jgi:hypothetical protein